MAQYKITFRRYDSRTGETRWSTPLFVSAPNFTEAHEMALIRLGGMQETDPEREYDIAEIVEYSSRYVKCDGARRWETREELTARLTEGKED